MPTLFYLILLSFSFVHSQEIQDTTKQIKLLSDSLIFADSLDQKNSITDSTAAKINPLDTLLPAFNLALFLNGELRFVNFEDRSYFQNYLDSLHLVSLSDTINLEQGIRVQKDNFENVDMTFPLLFGMSWRTGDYIRILISAGYLYHSAEGLITEGSRTRKFRYQLESFPLQGEMQINIPLSLLSEKDLAQLFLAFRFHSSWDQSILRFQGNKLLENSHFNSQGWGITIGGRHGVWKNLELESYIGLDYLKWDLNGSWQSLLPSLESKNANPKMNAFFIGSRLLIHLF